MGKSEAAVQDERPITGGCPVTGGWLVAGEWLKMLDEYGVQFLALDLENDSWLVKQVQAQPEWVLDFQDGESALFVRKHAVQTAT